MATAEIQTHTRSAARARKIWVVMRLRSDFPATMPGSIRRPKYANSRIAGAFRHAAYGISLAGKCSGALDFREFPTTLSQCLAKADFGLRAENLRLQCFSAYSKPGRRSPLRKCTGDISPPVVLWW